jgi:hypothetical protein
MVSRPIKIKETTQINRKIRKKGGKKHIQFDHRTKSERERERKKKYGHFGLDLLGRVFIPPTVSLSISDGALDEQIVV